MANKVYGPIFGAGTQIQELEGEKQISPGALGWAGYGGILEKGPVGELIFAGTSKLAQRRVGSYLDDSLCPDAIYEYYKNANGAGGLVLVRVTDGNELQAEMKLYARMSSVLTHVGTIKAHNGGRWGGKLKRYTTLLSAVGQVTETVLSLGASEVPTVVESSFETDEYKGGYIQFGEVGTTQYKILGNVWNSGTSEWDFTVEPDLTMATDLGGSPTDLQVYITRENESKAISIKIRNGEENPDTEFALDVYVDGDLITSYPNLSMDPASSRYWVDIINNDSANYEIEATNVWVGSITSAIRPANIYGKNSAVTALTLTAEISDFTINSPGGGDPTFALGTTTDLMVAQKITVTMTSPTAGDAVSDKFGDLGSITLGTLFTPDIWWAPPFTVTAGGTALSATDTLIINYKPFVADSLIGGYLFPDQTNSADRNQKFRIVDNTHQIITVADGSDMTTVATTADDFRVEAALELEGGRDGNADVVDASYNQQLWDVDSSPFNRVLGLNMGLLKLATPGVNSTAVQKAGIAYADAKNHQYRVEFPSNITTEDAAIDYINDTIGRSHYSATIFPSYAYMADPQGNGEGKLKLVPVTGMVHGREARIAVDNFGYHKAEAGIDATLPAILKLPTGDAILDQELLNPKGIPIIIKKQGNFVIWGDRLPATDPTWRWKHQREAMSYYEHVLQESYDWIIFALNNVRTQQLALASLRGFFQVEYNNKAFDDAYPFDEAVIIKLDDELNTPLTKENGDLIAEVQLRFVNTVERFVIRMGKAGIFEAAV